MSMDTLYSEVLVVVDMVMDSTPLISYSRSHSANIDQSLERRRVGILSHCVNIEV